MLNFLNYRISFLRLNNFVSYEYTNLYTYILSARIPVDKMDTSTELMRPGESRTFNDYIIGLTNLEEAKTFIVVGDKETLNNYLYIIHKHGSNLEEESVLYPRLKTSKPFDHIYLDQSY